MEDRRGEHGIGAPLADAIDEVLQVADTAGGDDRNLDGIGDGAGQRQIKTVLGPVAVHAGQQDFPGAEHFHPFCPVDRIDSDIVAPAMREHIPLAGRHLLGVDGDDDALGTDLA